MVLLLMIVPSMIVLMEERSTGRCGSGDARIVDSRPVDRPKGSSRPGLDYNDHFEIDKITTRLHF